ncbi:MAG: hypothetical protein ACREI3_03115, partial [Nitrospirales bacterium]
MAQSHFWNNPWPAWLGFASTGLLIMTMVGGTVGSAWGDPGTRLEFAFEKERHRGAIPIEEPVTLSVTLREPGPGEDDLVVVVRGPGLPTQLVPLVPDEATQQWTALVTIAPEPPPSSTLPFSTQRLDLIFARMRGTRLNGFLMRSLFLTVHGEEERTTPKGVDRGSTMAAVPDR